MHFGTVGIVIKNSLRSTVISYIGIAIGAFNLLWLFPKYLEPSEIGILNILLNITSILVIFTQLGVGNVSDKFFPYFKNDEKKNNGFLSFLFLYGAFGLILFSAIFPFLKGFLVNLFGDKSPEISSYIHLILPFVIFFTLLNVCEAYIRANQKIFINNIIKDVYTRIAISILTIFYAYNFIDFNLLASLNVYAYGVGVLIYLVIFSWINRLYLNVDFAFLKKPILKEIGVYAGFIVLGGSGSVLLAYIDSIMVGYLSGLTQTGIYAIAFYIGTVIEVPRRAISQATVPLVAAAWKNNDLQQIKTFYQKTSINQLIISIFLFLGIWCNVDELFMLIPNGENFVTGKYVILFIGIARILDMAAGINGEIILYSKYFRFNLIAIVILGVLNIVFNYLFIKSYGLTGAAFATMLSLLIFNIIKGSFIYSKYKIHPFTFKTIYVLGYGILIYLIVYFLPVLNLINTEDAIFNILIKGIIISILFGTLVIKTKVSEDINAIYRNLINKF